MELDGIEDMKAMAKKATTVVDEVLKDWCMVRSAVEVSFPKSRLLDEALQAVDRLKSHASIGALADVFIETVDGFREIQNSGDSIN